MVAFLQQLLSGVLLVNFLSSISSRTNKNHYLHLKNISLPFPFVVVGPQIIINTDTKIYHSHNSDRNTDIMSLSSTATATATIDTLTFLSTICGKLKNIKRTGWIRHKIPNPESDSDHMHRCAMCALLVTTQPPHPNDDYITIHDNKKFHPSLINSMKLIKMAMTHDLCEAIAGDITPFCNPNVVNSKHEKEQKAMEQIRKIVGDPLGLELYDLWREYEEQETVEALYCKDIDKFEMVMQAYEYELEHLAHQTQAKKDQEGQHEIGQGNNMISTNDKNSSSSSCRNDKDIIFTPLRTFFITTNDKMKSPLFKRLDAELRQKREALLKERGWEVTQEERQNYNS